MSRRDLFGAAGSRLFVAVDGSQQSICAAEEACAFLKESDKVWAVNVFDPDKDYLPAEFLPEHIERDCGMLFEALPESNVVIEAPELQAGQTVFGVLASVRASLVTCVWRCVWQHVWKVFGSQHIT